MKHTITEDVTVNVNVEFDKDDAIEVIDKVQTAVITVIVISAVAHIFKTLVK